MLRVEGLTKTYPGNQIALDEVSFTLVPHQFTAVLGLSGAGKTTLMRSILQVLPVDRGRVWLGDRELTNTSPQELQDIRAQIALVAQQFNLVRRRSALENCLGGRLREVSLWQCLTGNFGRSLLLEGLAALDRVKLVDVAFQRADRLSGGQQQRVAIARALVQNAQLILADEPVASLDPQTSHHVLQILRSLCEQEGLTVLCNLHQVDLAQTYSDRILGLQQGKLVLDVASDRLTPEQLNYLYTDLR
ncbi:phosphonate ABC transporter ATP-binding protein [Roseofilum sp. BLCC_M154]|uniref:Phosphonate ABC transporter ATP-binding protein n=1 Tax=Roseofilum acuticapitatum BLCC-M154 TaxID=3022444 RepID=A0ABT7AXV7_9CYAN|nr:phosphonate ABC transporter ATP-binding protein [Roseofilum acuticapitatum]MDJ1170903.1 phosphonate ABC transporter ATP-binding protein [Roseofilum acuticapitatum BLCC-M154]